VFQELLEKENLPLLKFLDAFLTYKNEALFVTGHIILRVVNKRR
jgi:hypothetical protein